LTVLVFTVVGAVLDVDLGLGVTLVWFAVVVPVHVDVNVAVETLLLLLGVETLVLAARVEAVLTAFFEAVLAAAAPPLDADILFSAEASWAAAVVFSGGDADVLADGLLVTGRAGLLGWWWLLTFPSSAFDRYFLLSLDLFSLLGVFVGRRKDAERDWDSGVEIQPGDFWGTRVLCKTATRLAKQRSRMRGEGEVL